MQKSLLQHDHENTPQAPLISILSGLVPLHGLEPRIDKIIGYFRDITAESLAWYPSVSAPRLSTLTSDSLPFEVSVSLTPKGSNGLRYGTEAGYLKAPFPERLLRNNQIIERILERIGAVHMRDMHRKIFDVVFAEYGDVASVKIIKDKFSGRSKGFGFVDMQNDDAGETAIKNLDGKEVNGRNLRVNKAHSNFKS